MSAHLLCASDAPTPITESFLESVFLATLAQIDWQPTGDISLAFVNKTKSRELNSAYAGNDYATDVLSFDYSEDHVEGDISGEIVICTGIAREQSQNYGIDFSSEVALLLTHGLLHLSGKDHQTKADQASFDTTQGVIIKTLKLQYRPMLQKDEK